MKYFIILIFALYAAQASAQTVKMTCRGGPETQIHMHYKNQIEFTFKQSTNASPFGINPGECALMDRPVSSTEYKSVRVVLPQGAQLRAFGTHGMAPDQFSISISQLSALGGTTTWLNKLRSGSQAFVLDVLHSPFHKAWMATPGTL